MKKRSFTAEYKARIVLEVLKEEKTLSEIAAREQLAVTQLSGWKREFGLLSIDWTKNSGQCDASI